MLYKKIDSIENQVLREYNYMMTKKNNAQVAYIAMMVDVELPSDEDNKEIEHE